MVSRVECSNILHSPGHYSFLSNQFDFKILHADSGRCTAFSLATNQRNLKHISSCLGHNIRCKLSIGRREGFVKLAKCR